MNNNLNFDNEIKEPEMFYNVTHNEKNIEDFIIEICLDENIIYEIFHCKAEDLMPNLMDFCVYEMKDLDLDPNIEESWNTYIEHKKKENKHFNWISEYVLNYILLSNDHTIAKFLTLEDMMNFQQHGADCIFISMQHKLPIIGEAKIYANLKTAVNNIKNDDITNKIHNARLKYYSTLRNITTGEIISPETHTFENIQWVNNIIHHSKNTFNNLGTDVITKINYNENKKKTHKHVSLNYNTIKMNWLRLYVKDVYKLKAKIFWNLYEKFGKRKKH